MVPLVFALALACYWPALHGAILWDDPAHIPRPEARTWAGLGRIWTDVRFTQQYYPVLFTAFWLEHRLWGDATLGYHLTNVLLHATSCCLLALLLRRLWSRREAPGPSRGIAPPPDAAWLAALLFAVHPIAVESVAWITEQKNTLSLAFYLLAALLYLDFDDTRRGRRLGAASVCFVLALGSKTSTVTLPAALLVVLWWKHGRLGWRRDVLPLLPWFAASAASGLLTSWLERNFIGARGVDFDLSIPQRVMLAGRVVWFYVGKLLWPADLNFFYPRWDASRAVPGWAGFVAAALAVTIACWLVRRRSRGPLALWLLFVGSLFPVLGLFKVFFFVFSYVNDHFVYLASLGLFAGAAAVIGWVLTLGPRWSRISGMVGCALLLAALGLHTRRQSALYTDNETLFRATLAKNPEAWMAHLILGFELGKDPARHAEAVAECRRAVALKPGYADAQFGLAVELAKTRDGTAEAIEHYERALALWPEKLEARVNLGVLLSKEPGRLAEAVTHYEAALRIRPDDPEIHNNLANALARLPGRSPEALAHYQEALRLRPAYPEAHHNLAVELARHPGRAAEARAHFEAALAQKPGFAEAREGLAAAHYLLAEQSAGPGEAIPHLRAALEVKPDFAEAHGTLAAALAATGASPADVLAEDEAALKLKPSLAWVRRNRFLHLAQTPGREADALADGEALLRSDPEFAEGHNVLGVLEAQRGRLGAAEAHWRRALELQPNYGPALLNLRRLEQLKSTEK